MYYMGINRRKPRTDHWRCCRSAVGRRSIGRRTQYFIRSSVLAVSAVARLRGPARRALRIFPTDPTENIPTHTHTHTGTNKGTWFVVLHSEYCYIRVVYDGCPSIVGLPTLSCNRLENNYSNILRINCKLVFRIFEQFIKILYDMN